jgi:hypothetical protein
MLIERTRGLATAAKLAVMAAALAVAGAAHASDSSAPPNARNVVTDTTRSRQQHNCFSARQQILPLLIPSAVS